MARSRQLGSEREIFLHVNTFCMSPYLQLGEYVIIIMYSCVARFCESIDIFYITIQVLIEQ